MRLKWEKVPYWIGTTFININWKFCNYIDHSLRTLTDIFGKQLINYHLRHEKWTLIHEVKETTTAKMFDRINEFFSFKLALRLWNVGKNTVCLWSGFNIKRKNEFKKMSKSKQCGHRIQFHHNILKWKKSINEIEEEDVRRRDWGACEWKREKKCNYGKNMRFSSLNSSILHLHYTWM